jgi:hypothetical protein
MDEGAVRFGDTFREAGAACMKDKFMVFLEMGNKERTTGMKVHDHIIQWCSNGWAWVRHKRIPACFFPEMRIELPQERNLVDREIVWQIRRR